VASRKKNKKGAVFRAFFMGDVWPRDSFLSASGAPKTSGRQQFYCRSKRRLHHGMVSATHSGENGRLVFAPDSAMSVLTFLQVLIQHAGDFHV
jgi:hypothetical protein